MHKFIIVCLVLFISGISNATDVPWHVGEQLNYTIDYGPINAGSASLSITDITAFNGYKCWKAESKIRSNQVFSAFYKVRDKAVSYIDTEQLFSRYFSKRLREGDYRKNIVVEFDQENQIAKYLDGKQYEVPANIHDVLSATYYLRTIDLHLGSRVVLKAHSSRKNYDMVVEVVGRETISVPAGTFDCWIVEPLFEGEGLFSYEGKITIWVSIDDLHLPVLTKTEVKVGAVTASLSSYSSGVDLDVE